MVIIYCLNITIAIVLYFSFSLLATKTLRLKIANPFTIYAIILFPVFLLENILAPLFYGADFALNEYYNEALFIYNIYSFTGILSIIFFYLVFNTVFKKSEISFNHVISKGKLKRISNITLILFVALFVLLSSKSEIGISGWLMNPRDGYQNYREGNGFLYAFSLSTLSASYFTRALALRSEMKLFICAILYCVLVFFLGSKTFILSFAIFYLAVLSLNQSKFLKFGLILVTPLAACAILYNLFLAIGNMNVDVVLSYFDQYQNSIYLLQDLDKGVVKLFNGTVYFSQFWSYIPRSLFPEKPFVYGFLHVNEIYYPGAAESGHTPAFSKGMDNFVDYGYVGLVILTFLTPMNIFYGYIFAKLKVFNKNVMTNSASYLLLSLILISPSFGTYFTGPAYVLLLIFFMILFVLIERITLRGR
ncbi:MULTISPECIES: O-antigen polymerase [Escherichia]|uniref:O-antigen polymerase n=2 Tax=Enterobacteriaceae TaxID=543 RepID=UPI0002BC3A90|nr:MULTISPECIES: O-antigen polymerase [Escherichia]MBB2340307.1 oligosaccharide repeat unit polymerase [Escherichia sp. 93.0750]EFB2838363.1 oligosaccharide repeat unit polymerase [Escherichia coli]EFC0648231.1 oligosaccharide repeat unit polymerase [Escherichia coli]EFJ2712231.1 oligosaccharide repeat unit polymerase [Escherichia coli]EHS3895125.1 oligosaccharide repeat unit polymerase [Escherichia coli]